MACALGKRYLVDTPYVVRGKKGGGVMVPEWLDLAAVVVGALAGVLAAQERKLDLVGFVALCLICALGGGLLRDCIMQTGSVYALSSRWPIPLCVATALVGFMFPRVVTRFPNLYEWVDMVSVAFFVVAGTSKAMAYNLYAASVVLMGTITGVGGGMLRDVFLGEIPQVFRRSNLYALCAVTGSVAYYLCMKLFPTNEYVAIAVTLATVVLLRRVSLRLDIKSPAEIDLEPKVAHAGKRLSQELRTRKEWHRDSDG
ncbi:MAG: trimeric intracellular cation channel family protein [Coriobacteriales bacterium]|nr:trimeric intracellular cation channel family protein [Coriobacteriales bacterium]